MSNWQKMDDSEEKPDVEAKNHGGLDDWFKKEKWVDVARPKKKGKYQPCGRANTTKGKKPVCVPVNKAKNLSDKERKNRVRQKRTKEKESNPDKKPNVTKYSPSAGGKSNVSHSDSSNIKFSNSIINLSDAWKEIRTAAMGEENEPIDTELPDFMKGVGQDKAHVVTERLLMLAQSQFEYLNSMLDDSDQMKVENLTDTEEQGHLISMLWDRTNQFEDDEVGLVLEYLSDWIDAHPGESVFNYATLKPIVEEVFMRH
ncbi:MAG: hypothetical protein RL621_88 [Bacteroidota bacterium]|jgi:hypothetical protein